MNSTLHTKQFRTRRPGVVAIQVGVLLIVLVGFAALTVDVGTLYNARGDLQRASDAASLAGASVLVSDEMMRMRQGTGGSSEVAYITDTMITRVTEFAASNPSFGLATTVVASGDLAIGSLDLMSGTAPLVTGGAASAYNAVEVIVRREAGSEGTNAPVPFFFAPIFGHMVGETSASAVAVFDDRVQGIDANNVTSNLTPFTISRDAFESELAFGGDQYSYDEGSNTVSNTGDGIREIRLYPYPLSGAGYSEGDGNFGVLNIGIGNQGVSAEQDQILNGITPAQIEDEFGTSEPTFYDDGGSPMTYTSTGSPGLEAVLQNTIDLIVGEVVGFFLHDGVVLDGSNATYTISDIRFGRVMAIRLTGPPNSRGFYVQPISYNGGGVIIDPQAPSTGGLLGRIILAR